MTVGIRQVFQGLTQEQFDALNGQIDPASDPPAGLLYHASGPIENGWQVVDFWDSREQFDAFAPRIQAAVAASGVELAGPPEVTEYPIHETFPA